MYVPRRNWDSPNPSLPASVPLPPEPGGGGGRTSPRVRGCGSPNSDDSRKSLALCLLCGSYNINLSVVHCKGTVPKIGNKYFQKWNCAATFRIPTFMYLWAIYIMPQSVRLFDCGKIGGPGLYCINHSQIHECGNWERGRQVSFLGIRILDKCRLQCGSKSGRIQNFWAGRIWFQNNLSRSGFWIKNWCDLLERINWECRQTTRTITPSNLRWQIVGLKWINP